WRVSALPSTGGSRAGSSSAHRLAQEGGEGALVDVAGGADLDVTHVLAVALEETARIGERGAAQEPELHVGLVRVDVGDGDVPLEPAPVAPLHGLLQI